jgi:hypothetical protein
MLNNKELAIDVRRCRVIKGPPKRRERRGSIGALVVGVGVLLLGPMLPACATGGGGASEDPEIDALTHVPDTVFVVVKNRYRLDVNVYALYMSTRQFLGVVTTNNSSEFAVRGNVATSNNFRVLADPIGASGSYVTDEILVRKGDVVEVTVQDPLAQSFYSLY